ALAACLAPRGKASGPVAKGEAGRLFQPREPGRASDDDRLRGVMAYQLPTCYLWRRACQFRRSAYACWRNLARTIRGKHKQCKFTRYRAVSTDGFAKFTIRQ